MALRFTPNSNPTLGVEIELGLINKETGQLAMDVPAMLEQRPPEWEDSIKPEFMRSYLEFNTGVCNTVEDVRVDLSEKLQWGYDLPTRWAIPSSGAELIRSVIGRISFLPMMSDTDG